MGWDGVLRMLHLINRLQHPKNQYMGLFRSQCLSESFCHLSLYHTLTCRAHFSDTEHPSPEKGEVIVHRRWTESFANRTIPVLTSTAD